MADRATELAEIVDRAVVEKFAESAYSLRYIESKKSSIRAIVCPSCGLVCLCNTPPAPIGNEVDSRSDAACSHCKRLLTVIRYRDKDDLKVILADIADTSVRAPVSVSGSKEVHLVILGANFPEDVSIKHVATRLNRMQSALKFHDSDLVLGIGEPNQKDGSYSPDTLFNHLKSSEHRYTIGITNLKMEKSPFFIRLNGSSPPNIIVSLKNLPVARTKKAQEERMLSGLAAGILYSSYVESLQIRGVDKKVVDEILARPGDHALDLFHKEPRGCVFDFRDTESMVDGAPASYRLCTPCIGKVQQASVPNSILQAGLRIFKVVRTPTLQKSFFSIFDDPVLSFFFGGLLIGLLINIITEFLTGMRDFFLYIIVALVVIFILAKYAYDYQKSREKHPG